MGKKDMHYTILPKEKHAKARGSNMRVSTKHATLLCRAIRRKPLKRVRRLLEDLAAQRRSLGSKYYTQTAKEMLGLLNSCEKNAEALGLDTDHLMVHASAHQGTHMRRRRRKQKFGSKMKSTNVEIILKEKIPHDYVKKEEIKKRAAKKEEHEKLRTAELEEIREKSGKLREKSEELEKQVEEIVGKDIETHADERKGVKSKKAESR